MDFVFAEHLPIGGECRRVFLEEVARGKKWLASLEGNPDAAIHEIRKLSKRLRGLLLLARPVLGTEDLSQANRIVRDAARRFSAARDAFVLRERCAELRTRLVGAWQEEFDRLDGILAERHQQILHERDLREEAALASQEFDEAAQLVEAWDWSQVTLEIAFSAAVSNYRVAQRQCEEARHSRDPHDFHEWRKRVKYLAFHCRWLTFLDPEDMPRRAEAAEQLSSILGEHHDLAVLEDIFSRRAELNLSEEAARILICQSVARRAELEEIALVQSRDVHSDCPDALHERFARRLSVLA